MAESVDLLDPIISCTQWTFRSTEVREERTLLSNDDEPLGTATKVDSNITQNTEAIGIPEQETGTSRDSDSEWTKAHSALASACVTCMGNMVAANSMTRKLLWPRVLPILR